MKIQLQTLDKFNSHHFFKILITFTMITITLIQFKNLINSRYYTNIQNKIVLYKFNEYIYTYSIIEMYLGIVLDNLLQFQKFWKLWKY